MTVPVQDVLSGGGADEGTRPARARVAATAAAAVLAATLVALVVQQDARPEVPGTVVLTGTLRFDDITSRREELASGAVVERDGTAFGTARFALPDRELLGRATFAYDAHIAGGDDVRSALHSWGDARLDLGDTVCQGTFAWSNVEQPLEGGGALQVRCDDGATLAGRLAATPQPVEDLVIVEDTVIDVRDGWYRAGG